MKRIYMITMVVLFLSACTSEEKKDERDKTANKIINGMNKTQESAADLDKESEKIKKQLETLRKKI